MFDKNPNVNQGEIVENKRLGAMLAAIHAGQVERDRLRLSLLMGMRASEIICRVVRDLDDEGRLLWIPETKTEAGKRTLLFRPLFLFFLLNQGSRHVVHIAATRSPTQEWTAQQLRNATMEGLTPRFLIRDRDEKFGATFDRVAEGAGSRVIKTAVRTPNMNPVGERFVGSLRREAIDHVLLLHDRHLENVARQLCPLFQQGPTSSRYGAADPGWAGERQPRRQGHRDSSARRSSPRLPKGRVIPSNSDGRMK